MEVCFTADAVRYLRYGFPGATVFPAGVVPASQIQDADWKQAPPELRTAQGETLFVPAPQGASLARFCRANGITYRRRADIWADLLEPFLDTSFDIDHQVATGIRLARAGLPQDDVADIRRWVGPLMRSYNGKVWDWCHLGLCDLLDAASGSLVEPDTQATIGDQAAFYRWAMLIAERGGAQDW